MRLVHIADTHLGYRSYHRLTPLGMNQREADVELSFQRVIDQTIRLAPELVVLAGDIFDAVRPGNRPIIHAFKGFERLRAALAHAVIIMVAGNHDMPRSYEAGCILKLFSSLGVHVVDGPAQLLDFPALDLAVLAVPDNHYPRPVMRPEGRRRHNVLLLHGETGGILKDGHQPVAGEITDEELHVAEWSYIALGHYHVYREIAPNEFYSGSIDYTSTNIWGEHVEEAERGLAGKGIVERDLVTGAHTFHPLPRTRVFVDLPPISAAGLGAPAVSALIAEAVASIGGVDDKCVRLKVYDIERSVKSGLDHKMLRQFRRSAVHFHLDSRPPKVIRFLRGPFSAEFPGVAKAAVRRQTLDQLVAQRLRECVLPVDLERADFVALGESFFQEATEKEVARTVVVDKVSVPPLLPAPLTRDPYADDFTAEDEAAAMAQLGEHARLAGVAL